MALLDDIKAASPNGRKGPRCQVGQFLRSLDMNALTEWDAVFAAPTDEIGHVQIARYINDTLGVRLPFYTIGKHRRGECLCAR